MFLYASYGTLLLCKRYHNSIDMSTINLNHLSESINCVGDVHTMKRVAHDIHTIYTRKKQYPTKDVV